MSPAWRLVPRELHGGQVGTRRPVWRELRARRGEQQHPRPRALCDQVPQQLQRRGVHQCRSSTNSTSGCVALRDRSDGRVSVEAAVQVTRVARDLSSD